MTFRRFVTSPIPLHYVLELLHIFAVLGTALRHMFELSFALNFAIARNFSTSGRTFPGLQYMISRTSNMGSPRRGVGARISDADRLMDASARHVRYCFGKADGPTAHIGTSTK